jgi:hypothetical protein
MTSEREIAATATALITAAAMYDADLCQQLIGEVVAGDATAEVLEYVVHAAAAGVQVNADQGGLTLAEALQIIGMRVATDPEFGDDV